MHASELQGFISQYITDESNKNAAAVVEESSVSPIATELDSSELIRVQSVSVSVVASAACEWVLPLL
jgi:hypothetical protein